MNPKSLARARALIFDFDGTLVDSNGIKRKAFEACFQKFPGQRAAILRYCAGNNHVPRWDKFRHVTEKILGLRYTPSIDRQLNKRFEAATTRQIIEAPERAGAFRFLSRVSRTHRLGLLSSTPDRILRTIVRERGWTSLFRVIRGAPVNKAAWLTRYRRRHGLSGREVLFFGDTEEDARAAHAAGCRFIGVANPKLRKLSNATLRNFQGIFN